MSRRMVWPAVPFALLAVACSSSDASQQSPGEDASAPTVGSDSGQDAETGDADGSTALDAGAHDAGPTSRFIQTFLIYYTTPSPLTQADIASLARYDILDVDRYRYDQIKVNGSPATWSALRAAHPGVEIYLYEDGTETSNNQDSLATVSLNSIARYNVARGHSMGSLNGQHPELFLLDAQNARTYDIAYSSNGTYFYLMDFGSPQYAAYWAEAVTIDLVSQPWAADGVFVDNMIANNCCWQAPAKYPSDATWQPAMTGFIEASAKALHANGSRLFANTGDTRMPSGDDVWTAVDASPDYADLMLEEGALAVLWGSSDVQFYPEDQWQRSVDLLGKLRHVRAAYQSHTALAVDATGKDNYGQPVGFWDVLWYALGSYLLGKADGHDAYFMFHGKGTYGQPWWFDEYQRLDFERPKGAYAKVMVGNGHVYMRAFERGVVYVNPTTADAANVALPTPMRAMSHATLSQNPQTLPTVTTVTVPAHRAAFLWTGG